MFLQSQPIQNSTLGKSAWSDKSFDEKLDLHYWFCFPNNQYKHLLIAIASICKTIIVCVFKSYFGKNVDQATKQICIYVKTR